VIEDRGNQSKLAAEKESALGSKTTYTATFAFADVGGADFLAKKRDAITSRVEVRDLSVRANF
jgi:hypothetical protein